MEKERIVSKTLEASKDSIVVLCKAGRLHSWERLTPQEQRDCSREHIRLMQSVAHEYGIMRLEGFKLLSPKQPWQRFWVMEFPTLEGAEAWIDAEMAPPYGIYGYYEYYVARPWAPGYFAKWVTNPPAPKPRPPLCDADSVPTLAVDRSSLVVLLFGRRLPEGELATPEELGEVKHVELMHSVAREHGLMRLEGFKLIGPQPDWHRAWVIELPTLAGAEAWMEAEARPPLGAYAQKVMHLARKWSPDYFGSWRPTQTRTGPLADQ